MLTAYFLPPVAYLLPTACYLLPTAYHFLLITKAGLTPYLVGTADTGTRDYCASAGVAAAAIDPRLDVWTYQRKKQSEVTDDALGKTQWQCFRHHNSNPDPGSTLTLTLTRTLILTPTFVQVLPPPQLGLSWHGFGQGCLPVGATYLGPRRAYLGPNPYHNPDPHPDPHPHPHPHPRPRPHPHPHPSPLTPHPSPLTLNP